MSNIQYNMKTEPYEEQSSSRFGGTAIKTSRDMKIEFMVQDLTIEQRNLFMAHADGFSKTNLTLKTCELRECASFGGFGSKKASVNDKPYVSETELTLDESFVVAAIEIGKRAALQAQADEINAAFAVEKARIQQEYEVQQALLKSERIAQAQRERADAEIINWNENGKAIVNLYQNVAIVSKVEMDTRFTNWIKTVTAVDTSKQNGYALIGDFINNRTIELDNVNQVFLVAGTTGSRKHQLTEYRVVVLRAGKLESTDIHTDSADAGWSLRIRDDIARLLESLR